MWNVKQERTGWRDEKLSERHRSWGWDCPAIDIDFLMVEYDEGKSLAIVEYKNENATPQKRTHASYQALIDLGNRACLPVFFVRYATDFSWWKVTALNEYAEEFVPKTIKITEKEWVEILYSLRGRKLPKLWQIRKK